MTFIRSLYSLTKRENLRNVDIRSELQETNIVEEIEHYWKKWKEHVLRMPPPRYPRQELFHRLTGVGDLERRCRRWRDQF
jgi:hypothetical protein